MNFYKNAKVIFIDKIRDCTVVTNENKIVDICDRFTPTESDTVTDCNGLYLSPGFVDIHVHGGGGKSAMSENPADITDMAQAHLKYGTTSIVPTTLTAPPDKLKKAVLTVKAASEQSKNANILGVHMEGPYISPKFKGAQSEQDILSPESVPPEEFLDLWDKILMMGAAPECAGVPELGDKLRERGIIPSIAHSAASYEQVENAIDHGFCDVTHIYNACSSCFKTGLFRTAGVVEAGLYFDALTTQVIADLKHLPQGLLNLIYKCKGDGKMYLITDGLEFSACDVKENTVYRQENGLSVIYEDGVMKLADRSALAGSTATLSRCVRNMRNSTDAPLYSVVRAASYTPACVCGYGNSKGKIEKGFDADLIIFDDEINVKSVITNGKTIIPLGSEI